MPVLRIATCQFPVSGSLTANARAIRRLMRRARHGGAELVHFSETCLSGYPGVDLPALDGFDWLLHRKELEGIAELARELGVWVVVGSSHPLSGRHKPHNSLYVIDAAGNDLAGLVCTLEGDIYRVPFYPQNSPRREFQRLEIKRITTAGWTLPQPEAPSLPLFDDEAELDGLLP